MGQPSSDGHAESPVKMYWGICVALCLLTFFEWLVFEYQQDYNISNTVLVILLASMSLVKFFTVVGWYMHLKYDHIMLKYVFVFSLLLGTFVCGLLVLQI